MNIKLPKSSTLLFVNILIFLFITLFAYFILQENIKLNNSKNQEILFFKIKDTYYDIQVKYINITFDV